MASGGHSSLWCVGLSLSWPLLLRSTGSRHTGSVVVAHRPRCSVACGIFPDQGSNPFPLHYQADSQPLCHQGSPIIILVFILGLTFCILILSGTRINTFPLHTSHFTSDISQFLIHLSPSLIISVQEIKISG